jgi:DMSO/TMAO reductase YedYZ molybdopterin-dependent catalytic subunit
MNTTTRSEIIKVPIVLMAAIIAMASLVSFATDGQEATLSVTGELKTPLKLTMTELKAMPAAKVTVKDHDGTTAVYEGVPLHDILSRAGAPQGETLRGDALQLVVLVKAADGYKVALSLAEPDPLFADKQVLLAYQRNALDLDAKTGPLRLVIPDEKRQARWVRQVTELEIVRAGSSK